MVPFELTPLSWYPATHQHPDCPFVPFTRDDHQGRTDFCDSVDLPTCFSEEVSTLKPHYGGAGDVISTSSSYSARSASDPLPDDALGHLSPLSLSKDLKHCIDQMPHMAKALHIIIASSNDRPQDF